MDPFVVKDCALAVVATGESVSSLAALHSTLARVAPGSIYYHFWGGRLRPAFVHPEYLNDFAKWAHFSLHDNILAERLAIIDPTDYKDLEELRQVLLDIIEKRIDETDFALWLQKENQFHFLRSVIVIFNTHMTISHPSEWKGILPTLSLSSIFYHFIDARRRTSNAVDDFTIWLEGFNEEFVDLIQKIRQIDPYFFSLSEIRQRIVGVVNEFFP